MNRGSFLLLFGFSVFADECGFEDDPLLAEFLAVDIFNEFAAENALADGRIGTAPAFGCIAERDHSGKRICHLFLSPFKMRTLKMMTTMESGIVMTEATIEMMFSTVIE